MENNNLSLFEDLDEFSKWKEHWENMPEFNQKDDTPFKQVVVSFRSQEDLQKFAELIGQKITYKTKGVWFPKLNEEKPSNFIYIQGDQE
jgi:hypothetical protein